MADGTKVIVGLTHGKENHERVTIAYLMAGAALDQGKQVVMWLTEDAVHLGTAGYAEGVETVLDGPPVERLHEQFIDKGGRFYVCPICAKGRDVGEAELIDAAELKGATPLFEFAGDGAMTFNY